VGTEILFPQIFYRIYPKGPISHTEIIMRSLPVLFLLGAGWMYGSGFHTTYEDRQCSNEYESLRFVATPQGPRVPLYGDRNLITYLTDTYAATQQPGSAGASPVVLPLYSANPQIFRSGNYVFVTTGMLTRIHSEAELLRAFETPARVVPARREAISIRSCGVLTTDITAFGPVWSHFTEALARYEAGTHLRLKRRPAEVESTPADTTPLER
jgi:hypothetical protein